MAYRVFISYVDEDRDFVNRLGTDLSNSGIEVWDFNRSGHGFGSIPERVRKALRQADALLSVHSHVAVESAWAAEERDIWTQRRLVGRSSNANDLPHVFVTIDDAPVPFGFQHLPWFFLGTDSSYSTDLQRLVDALHGIGSHKASRTAISGRSRFQLGLAASTGALAPDIALLYSKRWTSPPMAFELGHYLIATAMFMCLAGIVGAFFPYGKRRDYWKAVAIGLAMPVLISVIAALSRPTVVAPRGSELLGTFHDLLSLW